MHGPPGAGTAVNPVAQLRGVTWGDGHRYEALMLWCPGCQYEDDGVLVGGLHMLPVSGDPGNRAAWTWDGSLEAPTLSPSILTRMGHRRQRMDGVLMDVGEFVCHSFLRAGVWEFLGDCTHALAGQSVPAAPLPDWVVREG